MIRAFHSYRSRKIPCNRLAPLLFHMYILHDTYIESRLLGFIGSVPPPAQDKRVSVQSKIIPYHYCDVNEYLNKYHENIKYQKIIAKKSFILV